MSLTDYLSDDGSDSLVSQLEESIRAAPDQHWRAASVGPFLSDDDPRTDYRLSQVESMMDPYPRIDRSELDDLPSRNQEFNLFLDFAISRASRARRRQDDDDDGGGGGGGDGAEYPADAVSVSVSSSSQNQTSGDEKRPARSESSYSNEEEPSHCTKKARVSKKQDAESRVTVSSISDGEKPAARSESSLSDDSEPRCLKKARIDKYQADNNEAEERNFSNAQEEDEASGSHVRLRDWQESFQALQEYKVIHGHCSVPNNYNENSVLGRWVKSQRYQYKLRQGGKPSTLTDSRVEALEKIGFVWDDSHAASLLWDQRLNDLKAFCEVHGHCNVPATYPENPQLSTWVKCQRRQYKLYVTGESDVSYLTQERIAALEKLGFEWDGRVALTSKNHQR